MSMQDPNEREALRQEIQAAIKAGRDLDPEMDQHLADSALDRFEQERSARDKALNMKPAPALVVSHGPNPNLELVIRTLVGVGVIALIVTGVVFGHGWGFPWWIFFVFPGIFWWGRGRRHYRVSGQGYIGQPSLGAEEEELRRQERATKRRLKIQVMEAEIARMKKQGDEE